ncbi:hypothetical protein DESC_720257 [Desulfosarcina cetonica]|nr:hypothetical protein DESC_720257 [Desulfosarcina cetonica]
MPSRKIVSFLVFVLGGGLLARSGQAIHGRAARRPVFQNTLLNQLVDDLLGFAGFHPQNTGQIIEVEFALGFEFFGQLFYDQLFCLFVFHG